MVGDAEEPVLQPGSVFAGRYQIVRMLGAGERKQTYLAKDTLLPRRVALALIKPEAAHLDPKGTQREAEALARAGTHDNVVTFYDWGVVEGTEYLVIDYLQGGTLREYLAKRAEREKPLSAEEVMRLGRQLARALAFVHKVGLIHRDVAPGNVWLDERKTARLGDFDSAVDRDVALDPAELPPTTEAYAAPEQITGGSFDQRSDLFSLGAVLYEALTGERPPRLPSGALTARLRAARQDIPRSLGQAVCRMLAESPDERPPDADAVLEAFEPGRVYRTVDEGLTPWADTLPFPLASILWHYDGEPDPAIKIDCLLKFFEALAQFVATIQLSACFSADEFLRGTWPTWFRGNGQRPLDLRTATFGTWVKLSELAGETIRDLLQAGNGEDRCRQLFAAPDTELADAVADPGLAKIFQHALHRRNDWTGHGGIAGQHLHHERLGELEDLLDRARALLGWSFEPWTLLKPGPMTLSRGFFELTATILKGPNSAFRKKQIRLAHALDAGRLYLLNDGELRALELAPFVRVLTGHMGQDACYFYNRLDGGGARWVSYHFHAEPELVLPDEDLADLLAKLPPPPATEPEATQARQAAGAERGGGARKHGPRSAADAQLYDRCQRCGYPFDEPVRQKFCGAPAACDRRLRKPGYRVPRGRSQDLNIRNATIAAQPELGPQ
jgi:tRNA A-37 threonylcarbamoyl transferase component Bud32